VLHFLAIANEMGIPLSIDDFDHISSKTPLLCDLKPAGNTCSRLSECSGSRLLAKRLIDAGLIDGSCINVTAHTCGRSRAGAGDSGTEGYSHAR